MDNELRTLLRQIIERLDTMIELLEEIAGAAPGITFTPDFSVDEDDDPITASA